jgi:D-serine deaminase-like pyridoxal phosphate-dependent protein
MGPLFMTPGVYQRLKQAIAGEPLPLALVDLDAMDRNFDRLVASAKGKRLRIASKSVRCPALLRYLADRGGAGVIGLMTYTAGETEFLAAQGWKDLLLAYPTVQPADLQSLIKANQTSNAAVAVDAAEQTDALSAAAAAAGVTVPVVIDVDMSYRPIEALHLGVRRSPLRSTADVVGLARRILTSPSLRLQGLQAYEAQIAGMTDDNPLKRLLKLMSRGQVEHRRAELARVMAAEGIGLDLFNGGGSGSASWAAGEPALSEITVGSGFLASHLFDHYRDLHVEPAAYFALQVVRRPRDGMVTCLGGGLGASGEAGPDRLPLPCLPVGLKLLPLEGAGEVQTPLRVPGDVKLAIGDPVFFRHAKAGELAEHFNEYLLIRGERIESRAPTYRGLGRCFLG